MKLAISYIFIIIFLVGIAQPTISVLSKLSDTSLAFYLNNILDANENSSSEKSSNENSSSEKSSNENSSNENSEENSEYVDVLNDFFHNQSLLHYFAFSVDIFHLLYETILVSGFTDIIIPPPKF